MIWYFVHVFIHSRKQAKLVGIIKFSLKNRKFVPICVISKKSTPHQQIIHQEESTITILKTSFNYSQIYIRKSKRGNGAVPRSSSTDNNGLSFDYNSQRTLHRTAHSRLNQLNPVEGRI